jgi:hypothetical protein
MKQILLLTITLAVLNLVFDVGLALATEESQVFHEDLLVSEEPLAIEETTSAEEAFHPIYSLHGSVELDSDSYFGNYPKLTEKNRKAAGINEDEFNHINQYLSLNNPTDLNSTQYINLDFYTNPLPDVELFINGNYGGVAGGEIGWSIDECYAHYYTEKAMYTLGRFEPEFGRMGLLLHNPIDGLALNTRWKDIWFTGYYSRLITSFYGGNYPYIASGFDDLAAFRFSWKYGENLLALNLIPSGFEEEKALSLDFASKIMNRSVTGEIGLLYPSRLNRIKTTFERTPEASPEDSEEEPPPPSERYISKDVEAVREGVYPGMAVSVNLIEAPRQMLRLAIGGTHEGFSSIAMTTPGRVYFHLREMEDPVKFGPNLWGGDLLYQRGINDNWILMLNLILTDYIDKEFFEQYQKPLQPILGPYPTRICGIKLKRRLSATSEISLAMTYYGEQDWDYGKIALNWRVFF